MTRTEWNRQAVSKTSFSHIHMCRLEDLWRATKPNSDSLTKGAPARAPRPPKRSLVDMLDLGDSQESDGNVHNLSDGVNAGECGAKAAVDGGVSTGEEAEIVREPWLQAALALLGKPVNTPVSDLVEADFELPARGRARLSAAGKVSATCQERSGCGNSWV